MIHLRYSNRTEELLRALAGDVAAARAAGHGLFEPVPLVVPNPQIETYVKLGVARENGVAAHLESRYLRGHLADIVAASAPDVTLVDRALVEGELLALFHDARRLAPDDLGPVRAYLAAGGEAPDAIDLRRAQLAAELATLFDEYSFARPELLRAWRSGKTLEGAGAPDDDKREQEVWQRAAWLALFGRGGAFEVRGRADGRRYVDLPGFFESDAARALKAPPATYVFGISYVARLYRNVFAALGQAGDVFIYTLNPCREFWEDLDDGRARRARAAERARFPSRRAREQLTLFGGASGDRGDESGGEPDARQDDPPALVLWARPGRENIKLLNDLAECDFSPRFAEPHKDDERPTLLTALQRDILDRVPAREGTARLALGDDSVTLRPCPNPRRELETIAAEIWKLAREGTRFTDVAIVVPPGEAETYLPLAAAVLREASELPHTIVDAPAAAESRVLEATQLLLALPLGPLGRQDLLRLVMHPVVAARFPDADPRDWLALAEELDIVHGADRGDHAGTYVEGDRFNWDQGLRRLALGAFLAGRRSGVDHAFTQGDDRYLPEELPPELQASAQAFGALSRALIGFATRARSGVQTVAAWMGELRREIAGLLVADGPEDDAALARVYAELTRLESVAPAGLRVRYRIAHELVRAALAALPGRAGRYLTQGVTVSTFLPMRAVPFQAVFVAGMGEGRFPAREVTRELDLRGKQRRVPGDVSAREQDEYMFLETLLCTRRRLTISWVDRDEVSGERLGASSTVLSLVDMLKAGYLRGSDVEAITRPAPPLRRHEDDEACAVIPAAARERRAARLGRSLQDAAGGRALPTWPTLRRMLAPEALAALGSALAWSAPPAGEPAATRTGRERRVLPFGRLLRFLQCPLQGSALATLPLAEDDADEIATAAFREHEDFELHRPRALPLLREALARAFRAGGTPTDGALAQAYEATTETAALDGTLPAGTFGASVRAQHLTLLHQWRDTLAGAGAVEGRLAPLWIGHGPEGRDDVTILPAPAVRLPDEAGGTRAVLLHGVTNLVATMGGAPTLVLLASSATKDNGYRRDRLRAFVDHVVLAAASPVGAPRRRVLVLRPDQDAPEDLWLGALDAEAARAYLTQLAAQLSRGVHPYFFPCEGVLGWSARSPRPDLLAYIHMLREDEWTRFTSDWGPIPNARDYPLPATEEDARRLADDRFGLYFSLVEEPEKRPRRAK
jgi:exodeoxyribonuclease V gamma subunit